MKKECADSEQKVKLQELLARPNWLPIFFEANHIGSDMGEGSSGGVKIDSGEQQSRGKVVSILRNPGRIFTAG